MSTLKGTVDTVIGKAKEKVGYAVGSDKLQAEGAAQALKGKVETTVSKKADKVREAVDDATDKL
ncbi:MAG: CsbD family protein [Proteobacteria bacterium]|nr:CsbD family protein [Pseudomonadota bacterium]